ENLLAACRIVKERSGPFFSLAIAGSGSSDYEAKLRREIERLDLSNEAALLGDLRGENKQRMFERTDVDVAPSFTENFAIVVAEALAHGAAVIASTGTPWKEVERKGCGLWVNNDPVSLADAISKINSMPVAEMGDRDDCALQKPVDSMRRSAPDCRAFSRLIINANRRNQRLSRRRECCRDC